MSDFAGLGVAVLLLAFNAFFVGAEFALVSARRSQIEPLASSSRMARSTLQAMEHVSLMMAGAQLGITICSLGLGAVAEPALAHLLEPVFAAVGVPEALVHPVAFVLALSVVVSAHVVLGEMVPKNIAIAGPDRAALALGPVLLGVVRVLRPVIVALNAAANGVLRLLRVEPQDEVASTFTRAEVAALVEESRGEGLLEEHEYDRLAGALGFTEKTVAQVLLPTDSLTTVSRGSSVEDVERLCAATGFSRFPVTTGLPDGDPDRPHGSGTGPDLVGYLHIKDVLETDESLRTRRIPDDRIRPFASTRDTAPLHEALETLQRQGAHLALVLDADGVTLGVAALEDVIEELVGEIRDAVHSDPADADERRPRAAARAGHDTGPAGRPTPGGAQLR